MQREYLRNITSNKSNRFRIPKWFANKAMYTYFGVLLAISVVWYRYSMPWLFMLISAVSIILFFYGGQRISYVSKQYSTKRFIKYTFSTGLIIRLIWVVFTYFHNISYFGAAIGDHADTDFYVEIGEEMARSLSDGSLDFWNRWINQYNISVDDTGYVILLGTLYFFTGQISNIFLPFIVKACMSAYTAVFIYKIGRRHFGEQVGRIAAIFCALNPNMIWWCGSMMKETDMVFICTYFIYLMDRALTSKRLTFTKLIFPAFVGMYIYLFRAALGAVAILAIFVTIVISSNRIISSAKKILVSLVVIVVLFIGFGESMITRTESMMEQVQGGSLEQNMEWRSKRVDGGGRTQYFAKYAGAAVFAPLIFTIPFPTFTAADMGHYSQMQMSGGNFIKNVLSFFVIYAMFVLLFSGEWRKHLFLLAYMLGYLLVLVVSSYAQSGRFHMPIWPFEMLFAAYGLVILPKKRKNWYNYALIMEVVFCFAWQWFKLKGRGMI